MIPWKMWFHGIRDYEPASLDLSGTKDHIMITGPNGAGKSTITYCMGAVLYSSKVALEGLKSHNLAQDESWKAQIKLLFKNSGVVRIDAPEYIEFRLDIVQDPGQPAKREYIVSQGDEPEYWDSVTKYTSGDRQYNFSAYKEVLQYTYKLDPDLFYLIWYQQEVNQFAVMHPEERFRRFAEMHGIDEIQRNWEESLEKLQGTEEELRSANIRVGQTKMILKQKKQDLDRYEDNRRRLVEGGRIYIDSLLKLEDHYRREQADLKSRLEQFALDISEKGDQLAQLNTDLEQLAYQLAMTSERLIEKQREDEDLRAELDFTHSKVESLKEAIDSLKAELRQVMEEQKSITHLEEEVHELLSAVQTELRTLEVKLADLSSQEAQIANRRDELYTQRAELQVVITKEQEEEQQHEELLAQYQSSFTVQQQLDQLDQDIRTNKDKEAEEARILRKEEAELERLEDQRDLSERQQESLAYFRRRNMVAYSLNDLLELSDLAQLKAENLFNAIKYTIFFDGMDAVPPNDLYHVPLHKLMPERSIMELPALMLQVKRDLPENRLPHAMKALWWVEQFFQQGDFRIQSGILVDKMGIRGAQESERYILSYRARMARKKEVETSIRARQERLDHYAASITENSRLYQGLLNILSGVKRAEAFRLIEHERKHRLVKFETLNNELDQLKMQVGEMANRRLELLDQKATAEFRCTQLQKEADFYVRLGQNKDKYEQLRQNERQLVQWTTEQEKQELLLKSIDMNMEELQKQKQQEERNLRNLESSLEVEKQQFDIMLKQRSRVSDELETVQRDSIRNTREIEDFKGTASPLFNAFMDQRAESNQVEGKESEAVLSPSKIRSELERGRAQFNFARNEEGIDPAAPENYKTMEKEFQRLEQEYSQTHLLFEQNRDRTNELEDHLETSINMRVLQIKQRFQSYMSKFQFEGEISWMRSEDRKGRVRFELHIKARKEGHQGPLEDVGLKARGGRVGKGVSGGEESLSSLLFALALLQNLKSAPDFIVMDEFDSALDEQRKLRVFDLYSQELERKLIILSPKAHEEAYLKRFTKAYIVQHNPSIPKSRIIGLKIKY